MLCMWEKNTKIQVANECYCRLNVTTKKRCQHFAGTLGEEPITYEWYNSTKDAELNFDNTKVKNVPWGLVY